MAKGGHSQGQSKASAAQAKHGKGHAVAASQASESTGGDVTSADTPIAKQTRKAEKAAAKQARKAEKAAAKESRKALKAAAKQTRKAEKAAAKQTRDAEKAAVAGTSDPAKQARKAEKAAVAGTSDATDPDQAVDVVEPPVSENATGIANAMSRITGNMQKSLVKITEGKKRQMPPGLTRVWIKFAGLLGIDLTTMPGYQAPQPPPVDDTSGDQTGGEQPTGVEEPVQVPTP